MAVTATKPSGYKDGPAGALKMALRDVVFSGNYATGGETLTPAAFGMKRFFFLTAQSGASAATALTTSNEYAITINAAGTSALVTMYENAAAGSPSAEKTNSEAFITGQALRILAVGY